MNTRARRHVGGAKRKDRSSKKTACQIVSSPPSIPSKFESREKKIFFRKENTAFGCSTTRFEEKNNFLPAPGQYHKRSSYIKDATKCGSVSARGFTAMISLDPRFSDMPQLKSALEPGPAAYTPMIMATKLSAPVVNFAKHDTRGTEEIKQKSECSGPGPGSYNLSKYTPSNSGNLGASSFKFTARKDVDLLLKQQSHVAVGSYDVGKSLDYIEKLGKAYPTFSSTSSRLSSDKNTKIVGPGPGHYEREPVPTYEMFRPSACFDTSLDRFGKSKSIILYREETPGPGSYCPNLIFKNPLSAIASFASRLQRFQPEYGTEDRPPGPAYYNPQYVSKKNFRLNRHNQWI